MRNERQSVNWLGLVQAAVLVGWATTLGWLGRGSEDEALLGRFLRADYWWIVYTAIWFFAALLASLAVSQPRQLGLDRRRSVIHAIILSLPLLYLPLALSSELSIEAAEKRSLYTPCVAVKHSELPKPTAVGSPVSIQEVEDGSVYNPREIVKTSQPPEPTQTERKLKTARSNSTSAMTGKKAHDPTLLDLVSNPESFEGSNATLVGMVYRDKRLSASSFYCYRLLMVCCAADASPIGVIVKWPETRKLKNGTWVKVQGPVGLTVFEGENYPTISAARVEKTTPPNNRFIVPQ